MKHYFVYLNMWYFFSVANRTFVLAKIMSILFIQVGCLLKQNFGRQYELPLVEAKEKQNKNMILADIFS